MAIDDVVVGLVFVHQVRESCLDARTLLVDGIIKRLRQVEFRTQAPDHPILWAADESYYLKFFVFQVCEEK